MGDAAVTLARPYAPRLSQSASMDHTLQTSVETSLDSSSKFICGSQAFSSAGVSLALAPLPESAAVGETLASTHWSLQSLHRGLVRDTLAEAIASTESDAEALTVRLDPADISGRTSPAAPSSPTLRGKLLQRPKPLSYEFFDEDTDEERANAKTLSLASSLGFAASSASRDSLAYTQSNASGNHANSTARTLTLGGLSGPNSLANSQGYDTVEALRSVLCDPGGERTPTRRSSPKVPIAIDVDQQADVPSLHASGRDSATRPKAVLRQDQLEAFSSAVKGAEGLDRKLREDLLALLKNMPVQLQSV